jgi:hypothetical protein
MLDHCPKCDHSPLPADQDWPAECPACGVILARAGQPPPTTAVAEPADESGSWLWHVPAQVDATAFRVRVALLAAFAVWGLVLCRLDYRDGEINESFIHRPLLIFHEAGHVIFRLFGEWMTVLGGSLFQVLFPAVLAGALLWKNRDPFGAAIGLWLVGVSLVDVSAYMYDALEPQLTLLGGGTGADSFHDWIWLFDSMHVLRRAQRIGAFFHALGAGVVVLALAWAAAVLRLQKRRLAGTVLIER